MCLKDEPPSLPSLLAIFLQLEPFVPAIVVTWQHGGSLAKIALLITFAFAAFESVTSLPLKLLQATDG